MKITASRAEDIRKAREEHDAETQKLKDRSEANSDRWKQDQLKLQKEMEQKVADMIGPTSLSLHIKADPWGYYGSKSWTITVNANEGKHFDDNVALIWHWEAKLDKEGNIVKDSGSWSGLKINTPEQVADLEESVRIIKILNNTDWTEVLNSPRAEWKDYQDEALETEYRERVSNRPKFEDDLLAAQLDDIIKNGNIAIQLKRDQYYNGKVWIIPTGLTDKFIKGYIFPDFYTNKYSADEIKTQYALLGDVRRSARTNIVLDDGNLVTLELN